MKLGMSTSCFFGRETVEDAVSIMANMGVRDIEVFLNTPSEYEVRYITELNKRIMDGGMNVFSVHPMGLQFEVQMYTPYQRTVDDSLAMYNKVLYAASLLGAERYIYHGGLSLKNKKMPISYDKIARVTNTCCEAAYRYGIELAYENVHWCWFNKPEFATELLKRVNADNFRFNLDIKQAAQSKKSYKEYLKAMGSRLSSVHICDHTFDEQGNVITCAPFRGKTDFYQLKKDLEAAGYDGPVILELYSRDYTDYSELKDIYLRMQELFS